ncbi:hypothetical protein Ccrd_004476, partial [Cynara cardunculus var. scolymus]
MKDTSTPAAPENLCTNDVSKRLTLPVSRATRVDALPPFGQSARSWGRNAGFISGSGSLKAGKFTVSDARETNPSLRPVGRLQAVPPVYKMTTASRAARARISAQETTPGHTVSICVFAASITSNPTKERLGGAVLSVDGPETSTDASQPKTKQSWKNILSKPAATAGLVWKADRTVAWTMVWTVGQVV